MMMPWKKTDHSISIKTPAKLNLFLEIIGKRDDGFHNLQTLIVPVDCFDELEITRRDDTPAAISMSCSWQEKLLSVPECQSIFGDLPQGNQNLVYQAVELFCDRCEINAGVAVDLVKSIPSQAGLGGASSDAAATLIALNELFQTNLTRTVMSEWAAELGSDVPFFIGQGTAVCQGRGEIVDPVSDIEIMDFVVVKPPFGLSTKDIFSRLVIEGENRQLDVDQVSNPDSGKSWFFNRLQQVAEAVEPAIKQICDELKSLGCRESLMTGSGSCCFGVCDDQEQAMRIANKYRERNSGFVFTCRNL